MSDKLKNAIAYVRVSTEEQGADGKYGIEVQQTKILEYCTSHGYSLQKIVVERESGAKERPLMNELVFGEGVDNPPYEAIIVYKNDRIARDMKLYFYYEYVLNKRGIELLCVQDEFLNGVDSSVATLYKAMMQFVAEQERKNITMRTSSGRLAKAKKGGYAGGNVPYGYKIVDHKLEIDEEEIKIVKFLFSLYETTNSVGKTKKYLDIEYPDLLGRNGKKLSYFTIRSIVSNKPFYQGLYHYGDLGWVKGEHEAVFELETDYFEKEAERFKKEIELEESGEYYG